MLDNVNGVPVIGGTNPLQDQQRAFAIELAAMSKDIYCQVIAKDFSATGFTLPRESMMAIARDSHEAAKAFYEGLGLVKFKPTDVG